MATIEKRLQSLEQENAARKNAEELLTIAVRALVSKEAFENLQNTIEKSQKQNDKLFDILNNHNIFINERLEDLQSQLTELDDKIARQQAETYQHFTKIETAQHQHATALTEQKNLLSEILARLPEKTDRQQN